MTNQGINREKIKSESDGGEIVVTTGRINRNTGRDEDANIDPRETYPVAINVMAKTTRQRGIATGNSAISMPPKVPTPFPPLNPAKIG